jgi:hypothetical protein
MGIISLLVRLVDRDFRRGLKAMLVRRPEDKQNEAIARNALDLRANDKFTLFESMHLKVHNTQFILDSLIAVTFYLARNTFQPSDQAKHQDLENKERSSEEVFSIETDTIKNALKTDQLNDFFNECKG